MAKSRLYLVLPIALSFLCFSEVTTASKCKGKLVAKGCGTLKNKSACEKRYENSSGATRKCSWNNRLLGKFTCGGVQNSCALR